MLCHSPIPSMSSTLDSISHVRSQYVCADYRRFRKALPFVRSDNSNIEGWSGAVCDFPALKCLPQISSHTIRLHTTSSCRFRPVTRCTLLGTRQLPKSSLNCLYLRLELDTCLTGDFFGKLHHISTSRKNVTWFPENVWGTSLASNMSVSRVPGIIPKGATVSPAILLMERSTY